MTLFLPAYSRSETDLDCVWVSTVDLSLVRLAWFNCVLVPFLLLRAVKSRPDIIYLRIFNSITPLIVARVLGAAFIVELNGNSLDYYRNVKSRRSKWVRKLIRWNLMGARKIVALTKGLKSEIGTDFEVDTSKVYVAPSGSNPEVFAPLDLKKCREELNIDEEITLAVLPELFLPIRGLMCY